MLLLSLPWRRGPRSTGEGASPARRTEASPQESGGEADSLGRCRPPEDPKETQCLFVGDSSGDEGGDDLSVEAEAELIIGEFLGLLEGPAPGAVKLVKAIVMAAKQSVEVPTPEHVEEAVHVQKAVGMEVETNGEDEMIVEVPTSEHVEEAVHEESVVADACKSQG